ncbi:CoA-binding protein [Larkinella terrae]|uniref:CoA-binding protein n=1 Tax=Larkinella terrae TaxID=2025311 RepID=A0A7K0EL28_9BACT|nr:CoA-binding protein [Larkinella terrae]MRS62412.1 CoA-binding protein [Larkinella terrae]
MKTKTLVVGASENPERYANKAANRLVQQGHEVELLGLRSGTIRNNPIRTGRPELTDIDTVTLYVSPKNQTGLYDYIKELKPRRVIFNPGTENPDFEKDLEQQGIEPVEACTLVMLAIGQY